MLKYDDVMSLLNSTRALTLGIHTNLSDSANQHFADITSYFASRKILLEQLRKFFSGNGINNLTQIQREAVNNLVMEIIQADNENVTMIDMKVKDVQSSMKKLQQQKSLLIYSKS